MLDVEKAFNDWVIELRKNYYLYKKDILELRDHFIDEVEDLVNERKISIEEAIQIAITNIGNLGELGKEYEKVNKDSFKTILGFIKRNSMKITLSVIIIGLIAILIIISMNANFLLPHRGVIIHFDGHKVGYNFFPDKRIHDKLPDGIIFPWQKSKDEEVWGRKECPMPAEPVCWYIFETYDLINDTFTIKDWYYRISPTRLREDYYAVIDNNGEIWFDPDGVFNNSTKLSTLEIHELKPKQNSKTISIAYSNNDIFDFLNKVDNIPQNNTLGPYKVGDIVLFTFENDAYNKISSEKRHLYKIGLFKMNKEQYDILLVNIPVQINEKSIFNYYIEKLTNNIIMLRNIISNYKKNIFLFRRINQWK